MNMNARIWVCGTIAAVCWFLGSSVPAAAPAPAGAIPATTAEGNQNELIVLVLMKNTDGDDAPVKEASVTLFVGDDAKQQMTETDGKARFPMPHGAQVTLRVVAANLKTQQEILSLQDAGAQPHKVFMEKQAADLVTDQ